MGSCLTQLLGGINHVLVVFVVEVAPTYHSLCLCSSSGSSVGADDLALEASRCSLIAFWVCDLGKPIRFFFRYQFEDLFNWFSSPAQSRASVLWLVDDDK